MPVQYAGLIPHLKLASYCSCTLHAARCSQVKLKVGDDPQKRDDVGWRIPSSNFKTLIRGASAGQFLQLQLEADVSVCTWNVAQAEREPRHRGCSVSLISPITLCLTPKLGLWKTARSFPERYAWPEHGLLWLGGVSACAVAVRDPACVTPDSVSKVYI